MKQNNSRSRTIHPQVWKRRLKQIRRGFRNRWMVGGHGSEISCRRSVLTSSHKVPKAVRFRRSACISHPTTTASSASNLASSPLCQSRPVSERVLRLIPSPILSSTSRLSTPLSTSAPTVEAWTRQPGPTLISPGFAKRRLWIDHYNFNREAMINLRGPHTARSFPRLTVEDTLRAPPTLKRQLGDSQRFDGQRAYYSVSNLAKPQATPSPESLAVDVSTQGGRSSQSTSLLLVSGAYS